MAHYRTERLVVDRAQLARSSHVPLTLSNPRTLTTYSTMLRPGELPDHPAQPLNPNLQRYTIQQRCRRQLCEDDQANQMVYVESRPPFNLRQGYGTQVEKQDDNEFMELLLRCLANRNLVGKTDFVCHRNLLTNLSVTPYEMGTDFDAGQMVVVQKIKGVFYMFEFPASNARRSQMRMDENMREMSYWGLKFPSYVRARPGHAPDPLQPLNLNEEFCAVVAREVGSHSILFRGEIDCIGSDGGYVELKTNKKIKQERQEKKLKRYKFIKWWLQCSIAGVETIVCGFRNDSGIVSKLGHYRTSELPAQMLECNPDVCMSFLDQFLTFVRANVEDEYIPHVFKRNVGSSTFNMTLDEEGHYKFLPLWFVEHVMQQ